MPSHGLRLRIFQRQFRSRFTLPLVWSLKDPLTLVDLEFYCQVIWSSCHHGCFIFHETTWVMPDIAPSLLMLPFTLLLQTFCVSWFLVQEKPELDNELACKRNVLLHPSPFGDFQALLYLLITFLLQRSGGSFEVQNSAAVATRRRKKEGDDDDEQKEKEVKRKRFDVCVLCLSSFWCVFGFTVTFQFPSRCLVIWLGWGRGDHSRTTQVWCPVGLGSLPCKRWGALGWRWVVSGVMRSDLELFECPKSPRDVGRMYWEFKFQTIGWRHLLHVLNKDIWSQVLL